MKNRLLVILAATLAGSIPVSALASGSAPSRRMPSKKEAPATPTPDARYAAGQAVYSGTAPLSAKPGSMESQKPRLMKVAAAVPDMKKGKSLLAMAGKLTAAQLDDLEYFVSVRFRK